MIIVMSPSAKDTACMSQTIKHLFVQAFVSELAIEAFNECVLYRLAGGDVMPSHAAFILPFKDGMRYEFCAVIADDCIRLTVKPDQSIQVPGNTLPREGGVSDQSQTLLREVVAHA